MILHIENTTNGNVYLATCTAVLTNGFVALRIILL